MLARIGKTYRGLRKKRREKKDREELLAINLAQTKKRRKKKVSLKIYKLFVKTKEQQHLRNRRKIKNKRQKCLSLFSNLNADIV